MHVILSENMKFFICFMSTTRVEHTIKSMTFYYVSISLVCSKYTIHACTLSKNGYKNRSMRASCTKLLKLYGYVHHPLTNNGKKRLKFKQLSGNIIQVHAQQVCRYVYQRTQIQTLIVKHVGSVRPLTRLMGHIERHSRYKLSLPKT